MFLNKKIQDNINLVVLKQLFEKKLYDIVLHAFLLHLSIYKFKYVFYPSYHASYFNCDLNCIHFFYH